MKHEHVWVLLARFGRHTIWRCDIRGTRMSAHRFCGAIGYGTL